MISPTSTTELTPHESIRWSPYLIRYLLPLIVLAVALVLFVRLYNPLPADPYPLSAIENHKPFQYTGSFNRDFNDLNDVQLESAMRIGINPVSTREQLSQFTKLQDISHITTIQLDELTHSSPLLIPEASKLLEDISIAFIKRLEQDTLPIYKPIITSVTRTIEDIQGLSKGNANASQNSTHRYGTTFDISWKRFHKADPLDPRTLEPEELKHLLAIVLRDFHLQERCYIKHEKFQACFHITAR